MTIPPSTQMRWLRDHGHTRPAAPERDRPRPAGNGGRYAAAGRCRVLPADDFLGRVSSPPAPRASPVLVYLAWPVRLLVARHGAARDDHARGVLGRRGGHRRDEGRRGVVGGQGPPRRAWAGEA